MPGQPEREREWEGDKIESTREEDGATRDQGAVRGDHY